MLLVYERGADEDRGLGSGTVESLLLLFHDEYLQQV